MAWNRDEPQDTTKIRDLGTVLRPNFQAIDSADSTFKPIATNFSDRDTDPLSGSSDPTPIADTYITYCKQDTNGNPELFGIDPAGVISQFTQTARTLAQTGFAVIAPGIKIQWGRDTLAGAGTTVTFPEAFSATAWVVLVTPYANTVTGSTPKPFGATLITDVDFLATALNGAGANFAFGWFALGPV